MRKLTTILIFAVLAIGLVAGCSSVDDKPAIRLTDNQGIVEPREVTVGYVNARLHRVPAEMIPDVPGDEGKREFMEEIVRKELLVIYGMRLGILEDPRLEGALEHFEDSRAEEMLREELIIDPAQVTPEQVEDYYLVRDDLFQVREISTMDEDLANEAYRRIVEDGEDFGRVAAEVSTGGTASDGGLMPVAVWTEFHPLTRVELRYLNKDDVTPVHKIGATYFIYQVASRKDPPDPKPLEGGHLAGITAEARAWNKNMLEYYLFTEWDEAANITYQDDAMDLCGTRIDEAAFAVFPETDPTTTEERMERARTSIIPEFTDEEGQMVLVTYNIFGDEKVVTLADFAQLSREVPGIETVKTGERSGIETFIRRTVQRESIEAKIEEKGYRGSQEMKDYIATKIEEFVIDITYDQEVVQKVDEPTGQEIRDYYRGNLDRFVEPAAVDVQQLIVATEEQANSIRQRVLAGEATFTSMVKTRSIDDWSKAKDGMIEKYRQGEKRLDYLQGVAFDLEIGELSEPVRAPGGYALVKLIGTHPSRQMSFDEVSDVVRQSVIATKREALLTGILDEARNTVTVEFVEENQQYIDDPAEVLKEKASSGTVSGQPVSIQMN
ncbi:MAG TPA: peptidyl-prolyl cis-trans isomerase [bacterium]|nr:peptidyl-prolyl cis-trans isomerase [bacterium]